MEIRIDSNSKISKPKKISIEDFNVTSINSIETKHPKIRQKSKAPTFVLTYRGTSFGLKKNCGFTDKEANRIKNSHHELYKVSDDWVQSKLNQATKDGYITVAFGLRVRTPILGKVYLNEAKTPYIANAESRTAANALGQSYGMLTNRALVEFMQLVWDSPYKYSVHPCAMIHDAIYLVIDNDLELVEWVNTNLIKCMNWQELPEIKHNKVKIEAEMDIHYGSWKNPITIPNNATVDEIVKVCTNYEENLKHES